MRTNYNIIAGQSLERLAALSDGIFAVAMTLLVLNLGVDAIVAHGFGDKGPVIQTLWFTFENEPEAKLLNALGSVLPKLLTYFMSFMTLGIFWVGQQTQLNNFTHSNRHLTWIHLAF